MELEKLKECKDCFPPDRYPGCQDHCPDFNTRKILKIVRDSVIDKQRRVDRSIRLQRSRSIARARAIKRAKGWKV